MDIQVLIERWAKAVRNEDKAGIRADHDSEILMFDVPPPFCSRGVEAYMGDMGDVFLEGRKASGI